MKLLRGPAFDKNRIRIPEVYVTKGLLRADQIWGDDYNGAFIYPSPVVNNDILRILVGCGDGWDHVSVSLVNRCPVWEEMDWVKRLFFKDNEMAYQLHVRPSDHINRHPYTLHLWRPQHGNIPQPPSRMV